jgi:hypothetical protein
MPAGPQDVVVTNTDGQSATYSGYIVLGPDPILISIDVPNGPVEGGRRMTLFGYGFRAGITITLDGIAATDVIFINSNTVTGLTPAHAEGPVTVTVTNDDLLSDSLVDGYYYYKKVDNTSSGNGCGTGSGFTVFLLGLFICSLRLFAAQRRIITGTYLRK